MLKKAVITGAGDPLEIVEGDLPAVPEEGALIKTLYAGICHSDIHIIKDEHDLGNGMVLRVRDTIGDKFKGICLGHEICGTVEKIGGKVSSSKSDLAVGDRVVVYPWIGCEQCSNCTHGMSNYCNTPGSGAMHIGCGPRYMGGYSTHMVVPKITLLVKLPDNIPSPIAAMLPCSASTAFSSLKKSQSTLETGIKNRGVATLLIIGAGGLGLWCTKLAKTTFRNQKIKVKIADISAEKGKLAIEAGADEMVLWNKEMSEAEMIGAVTNGGKDRVDVVINFVGNPATCNVGTMSLYAGGLQIINGLYGGLVSAPIPYLVVNSITIKGSLVSTLDELQELVGVASKEGLDFPNIQFFSLKDVNKGLDDLKAGRIPGRAMIKHE